MNALLRDLCQRYDSRFVDLTEPFFNSPYDYHWNEEGNGYAAEVLYRNLLNFGIVKDSR